MTLTPTPPVTTAGDEPRTRFVGEVREFVETLVEPAVQSMEQTGEVPAHVLDQASRMGLFGLSIPPAFGGVGLTARAKCDVEEVLGGAHYGFATVLGNHNGVGTAGLVHLGSAEQRDRYLSRMATGAVRGVFCLTETGAGSDAAAVTTTARRESDGWVLNGHKTLITQARVGGLFTVIARTPEGLSAFLVERNAPGLRVGDDIPIVGLRGSTVSEVHLEDCRVPANALLGVEGKGLSQALTMLNHG